MSNAHLFTAFVPRLPRTSSFESIIDGAVRNGCWCRFVDNGAGIRRKITLTIFFFDPFFSSRPSRPGKGARVFGLLFSAQEIIFRPQPDRSRENSTPGTGTDLQKHRRVWGPIACALKPVEEPYRTVRNGRPFAPVRILVVCDVP